MKLTDLKWCFWVVIGLTACAGASKKGEPEPVIPEDDSGFDFNPDDTPFPISDGGDSGNIPDGGGPSCPGFVFEPTTLETGAHFVVHFYDTEAYGNVKLYGEAALGTGVAQRSAVNIVGMDPDHNNDYHWHWTIAVQPPGGTWTFTFAKDTTVGVATCEKVISDTGAPPTLTGGQPLCIPSEPNCT